MIFLKSPGGSGTRYLYSCFGIKNLCGGREWFNPHQRYMDNLPKEAKVFYVMAHPLNILLSFEKGDFFAAENMIRNLQGDVNTWRESGIKTLEDYANYGVNMFLFADHHANHLLDYGDELANLTYETLGEGKYKIPLKPIEDKPFVKRRSDYNLENRELIRKLREIHYHDIEHYYSHFLDGITYG